MEEQSASRWFRLIDKIENWSGTGTVKLGFGYRIHREVFKGGWRFLFIRSRFGDWQAMTLKMQNIHIYKTGEDSLLHNPGTISGYSVCPYTGPAQTLRYKGQRQFIFYMDSPTVWVEPAVVSQFLLI